MNQEEAISEIRSFNRFYTNVISVLDRSVLQSGFSLAEARVLFEIGDHQPCSAREIMDLITIDEGYLSRILAKFAKKVWIKKIQSNEDKRQYHLMLSTRGVEQAKALANSSNQHIAQVIENIPDEEQAQLIDSMHAIQNILTKPR